LTKHHRRDNLELLSVKRVINIPQITQHLRVFRVYSVIPPAVTKVASITWTENTFIMLSYLWGPLYMILQIVAPKHAETPSFQYKLKAQSTLG